ncbi:MAG: PspA/IM30 family protein [Cyanobacteria bacterium P01_F01_bin.4]
MKKFVYWLMGDTAGQMTLNTWNWLWGITPEAPELFAEEPSADDQSAVQLAEKSLKAMEVSLQKLTEAVHRQSVAYQRAQQLYQGKLQQKNKAEQAAIAAQNQGNVQKAKLAMTQVVQLERILPQLETQLNQASAMFQSSQERLMREQLELETFRADLANMRDMAKVNDALAAMTETHDEFDPESARSQFTQARDALQSNNFRESAYAELVEDPETALEALELEAEVNRRLQQPGQNNSGSRSK